MGDSDGIFRDDGIRTSELQAAPQVIEFISTDQEDTSYEMAVAVLLRRAQEIASGELVLPVEETVAPEPIIDEPDLDPVVVEILEDIDAMFRKIEATKLVDSLPLE